MSQEQFFTFDIGAEIGRYFDDSSKPRDGEEPTIVILMGGPGAGKTYIRKLQFSTGRVLVDAGEIFLSLSRGGYYPFPEAFEQPMEMIGSLVARRAISERRHIVVELIGADYDPIQELFDALLAIGYKINMQAITCDIEVAMERNRNRGDDDISCYYAEPFQRRWLLEAARDALSPQDEGQDSK